MKKHNNIMPLAQLPTILEPEIYTCPIFIPRKHTVESYRAQQRRAKKRRKAKK